MFDLGKIIKEEAYRLVLDECTQYLFERWSHSDEIDKAVEKVYDAIADTSADADIHTVQNGKIELRVGSAKTELFGMDVTVSYYMYVAKDDESANFAMTRCYSENNFSEMNNELVVTIYTINGELLERVSNTNIYHEVEHVFQIAKGRTNNKNYEEFMDGSYERASNIRKGFLPSTWQGKNIAWLYYLSNPHEQDAFMNEYYYSLSHMRKNKYKVSSETEQVFRKYEDLVMWYNENKDDETVRKEVSMYRSTGMPKRNFDTMVSKGLKRFKRKMKNVEKHFQEDVKRLNENKIRDGIPTKHGSIIWLPC